MGRFNRDAQGSCAAKDVVNPRHEQVEHVECASLRCLASPFGISASHRLQIPRICLLPFADFREALGVPCPASLRSQLQVVAESYVLAVCALYITWFEFRVHI